VSQAQSSLESRTDSVGKILSRVGCSETQAEEPLPALCSVVKCVHSNPINPVAMSLICHVGAQSCVCQLSSFYRLEVYENGKGKRDGGALQLQHFIPSERLMNGGRGDV
jgi:hypothetical protein